MDFSQSQYAAFSGLALLSDALNLSDKRRSAGNDDVRNLMLPEEVRDTLRELLRQWHQLAHQSKVEPYQSMVTPEALAIQSVDFLIGVIANQAEEIENAWTTNMKEAFSLFMQPLSGETESIRHAESLVKQICLLHTLCTGDDFAEIKATAERQLGRFEERVRILASQNSDAGDVSLDDESLRIIQDLRAQEYASKQAFIEMYEGVFRLSTSEPLLGEQLMPTVPIDDLDYAAVRFVRDSSDPNYIAVDLRRSGEASIEFTPDPYASDYAALDLRMSETQYLQKRIEETKELLAAEKRETESIWEDTKKLEQALGGVSKNVADKRKEIDGVKVEVKMAKEESKKVDDEIRGIRQAAEVPLMGEGIPVPPPPPPMPKAKEKIASKKKPDVLSAEQNAEQTPKGPDLGELSKAIGARKDKKPIEVAERKRSGDSHLVDFRQQALKDKKAKSTGDKAAGKSSSPVVTAEEKLRAELEKWERQLYAQQQRKDTAIKKRDDKNQQINAARRDVAGLWLELDAVRQESNDAQNELAAKKQVLEKMRPLKQDDATVFEAIPQPAAGGDAPSTFLGAPPPPPPPPPPVFSSDQRDKARPVIKAGDLKLKKAKPEKADPVAEAVLTPEQKLKAELENRLQRGRQRQAFVDPRGQPKAGASQQSSTPGFGQGMLKKRSDAVKSVEAAKRAAPAQSSMAQMATVFGKDALAKESVAKAVEVKKGAVDGGPAGGRPRYDVAPPIDAEANKAQTGKPVDGKETPVYDVVPPIGGPGRK